VNARRLELCGAVDVIVIVGIAPVDEDIARGEERAQLARLPHPRVAAGTMIHTARGGESSRTSSCGGVRRLRTVRRHRPHRLGPRSVGHALVATLQQAPHHVGAHAPEPIIPIRIA